MTPQEQYEGICQRALRKHYREYQKTIGFWKNNVAIWRCRGVLQRHLYQRYHRNTWRIQI